MASTLRAMTDRYTIISADCHAGANHETYREYLAAEWHEEFDAWRARYRNPFRDLQDDGRTRNWDDGRRVAEQEADGVVGEVVFPNTVPPFFPTGQVVAPAPKSDGDFPRRLAGLHAHNRWLVDFVKAQPARRAGLGQIFLNDVDQAVRDVRWMKANGLAGVLVPGVSPDTPWIEPLYSPVYDPLWAVCEELGMPATTHSGGSGLPSYGRHAFTNALFAMETGFFANRTLWHLILSGVFDRFPNLKLVMTEQGSSWVPGVLQRMDALWERMNGGRIGELDVPDGAVTKRSASEYFRDNVWLGASFPSPADAECFAEIGIDKIMWGSDYPHEEGTYPRTRESLRAAFSGWDEPDLRTILAENIAAVYGFDLDALAPIAAEIGPTVAEIHGVAPGVV
jgi:predicted TIM-barrel fold metal-dependent hydrolase